MKLEDMYRQELINLESYSQMLENTKEMFNRLNKKHNEDFRNEFSL